MRKLILALALTGVMGTAVIAESSEIADNGFKNTSEVKKKFKGYKAKGNKKRKKYYNKTTKKNKRSGHKYNA